VIEVGQTVECKPSKGLGGWVRGRVIAIHDRGRVEVDVRGKRSVCPPRHVRPLDAPDREPPADVSGEAERLAVEARVTSPEVRSVSERIAVARAVTARLVEQPKPPAPARSEPYLRFVRQQPCCACSAPGPSDPHHFGRRGMGQKTDDYRTVPLCRRCHDRWHAEHVVEGDSTRAETTERFLREQVRLLVAWIRRCDEG